MEYIVKDVSVTDMFYKNDVDIQKKILKHLQTKPTDNDGVGYVYGFERTSDHNEENDFFVKIGRTEQSMPSCRIAQWRGNEIFAVKTIFNKKLERLVHLFFNFVRITRSCKGKNEIEWFHFFGHKINIHNILTFVSLINSMVCEIFGKKHKKVVVPILCEKPDLDTVTISASVDVSKKHSQKLNLKTCTEEDLYDLIRRNNISHIGPKKIDALITYKRLDTSVPGIGEVTYKKLLPYVEW